MAVSTHCGVAVVVVDRCVQWSVAVVMHGSSGSGYCVGLTALSYVEPVALSKTSSAVLGSSGVNRLAVETGVAV